MNIYEWCVLVGDFTPRKAGHLRDAWFIKGLLDTNDWEGLINNYEPAMVDIWVCYGWLCEDPRIPVDYHDLFPSSGEFIDVLCQVDSGSKSIEGPTIGYTKKVSLNGNMMIIRWALGYLMDHDEAILEWIDLVETQETGNAGECWSKLLDFQRVKLS